MFYSRPSFRLLLGSSIVLVAGCSTHGSIDSEPLSPCTAPTVSTAGWETVQEEEFSFRLPPGFQRADVQGIDSEVGLYRNPATGAEVSFDLGWYSNDLSFDSGVYSEYEACTDVIGGRQATVVTGVLRNPSDSGGRQLAAAAWRDINDSDPAVHLTVWNTAPDTASLETLLAVIRTVEFTPAGGS